MKKLRDDTQQSTQTPLVVIAGIPYPICGAVANVVAAKLSPTHRTISQPSGSDGNRLYQKRTVDPLLIAVSNYAVKQQNAHPARPCPRYIILAYVPADDDEELLAEFDFFAYPIRLGRMGEYDEETGQQRRHNLKDAQDYVLRSIQVALDPFNDLKRRLSSISTKEPLLLPPHNFKVSKSTRLADIFPEFRREMRQWNSSLEDIVQPKTATKDDLPRHIPPGVKKLIFCDERNLLFPRDKTAHAVVRELAPDSSIDDRKHYLQSAYRFGVPLEEGFHHDVQYAAGRNLKGEVFVCSRDGEVKVTGTHANVYPNDFVRVPTQ